MFLDIFPESGLAQSLHATIFVGLVIYWILHERFGFPLVGMVVPGYLGPLILIQPQSAALIAVEAVGTYLLVLLLSDVLGRLGVWYPLFGRDRFFLFLYVSIGSRLLVEGVLVPWIGPAMTAHSVLPLDFTYSFSSVGLICTALLANSFWKVGVRKGLGVVTLPIVLTTLFTAFVLMPFTDFNLIRLEYMYEELASNIAASPKAYIFLLIGAFLASRYNLKYGWDFSGILIPALLALTVFDTLKLGITLVEAVAIYAIFKGMIRLPWIRTLNLTGARPLMVCATIAFALKIAEGYAFDMITEERVNALDFYGFGYLLSSLLAAKMAQKDRVIGTLMPVVRTAIVIVLVANVLGVIIIQFREVLTPPPPVSAHDRAEPLTSTLPEILAQERVRIRRLSTPIPPDRFSPANMKDLNDGLQILLAAKSRGDADKAVGFFRRLDMEVVFLTVTGPPHRSYIIVREPLDRTGEERHGWGMLVINPNAESNLLFTVPRPLSEKQTLAIAGALFENRRARALVIAGTHFRCGIQIRADTLRNTNLAFGALHHLFSDHETVQIRGWQEPESTLFFSRKFPSLLYGDDASRRQFRPDWIGTDASGPTITAALYDREDQLHQLTSTSYCTLMLSETDRRSLLRKLLIEPELQRADIGPSPIQPLRELLEAELEALPGPGTGSYVPPTLYERLLFDEEVLQPLTAHIYNDNGRTADEGVLGDASIEADRDVDWEGWTDGLTAILSNGCRASGFDLRIVYDPDTRVTSAILSGVRDPERRSHAWGVYVFSLAPRASVEPIVIQAPNARQEIGTLGLAVDMYQNLNAAALMIPGCALSTNPDGTADVTRRDHPDSIYQLVYRRLLGALGLADVAGVELRGYSGADDLPEVIIGRGEETAPVDEAGQSMRSSIVKHFFDRGYLIARAEDVPNVAVSFGLSVQSALANRYRTEHWTVRCSREMRRGFVRHRGLARRYQILEALGFDTDPRLNSREDLFDVPDYLPPPQFVERATNLPDRLAGIDEMMRTYQETGDINALRAMRRVAKERGALVVWFADRKALIDHLVWREPYALGVFHLSVPATHFAGDPELQSLLPAARRMRIWWLNPTADVMTDPPQPPDDPDNR